MQNCVELSMLPETTARMAPSQLRTVGRPVLQVVSALLPQREKREEGGSYTTKKQKRDSPYCHLLFSLYEGIRMFFGVEAHHREMIGKRSRLVSPAVLN